MVDKATLVQQLHQIEELMRTFVAPDTNRKPAWDGRVVLEYSKPAETNINCDVMIWFARISTMEALIRYQDCFLSKEQIQYVRSWLAGGMLSLSDFDFDEKAFGENAVHANQELRRLQAELFEILDERV